MQRAPSRTNDSLLVAGMERLTGFKMPGCPGWDAYAEAADMAVDTRLPVALSFLVPLYERIPVVASVLRPSRGNLLSQAFTDTDALLCTNVAQSGKDALWLVCRTGQMGELRDMMADWTARMRGDIRLVARTHALYGVLAAPVEVFV